jgi:beta-lactamase regulating signal transducer with metallopeptidase domain
MTAILLYFFKLSASLTVVYLFYQLVLRRLTFYTWNRWYLLLYTSLCFFIPFIDLSPLLNSGNLNQAPVLQWVPVLPAYAEQENGAASFFSPENLPVLLILAGSLIMLARLLLQLFSFRRLLKRASLLSSNGVTIYQVDEDIIPFSFGNSIFINQALHSQEELEEIIRHEFVHVRQKHSADIIWSELLCLINWYNPFAWLLKKAIRQNLEFIADDKVLQNGISKKEYQYMLLKVIGNNQFSIAPKFNFSSLKKRIAMMNKNKSARVHLLRFLFMLPLIAVVLVSFRKQIGDSLTGRSSKNTAVCQPADTVPPVKTQNNKGYYIDIIGVESQCTVVIKDKNKKEVKRMLLTDWTAQANYYEGLYGDILPPPPAPPAPPAPVAVVPPAPAAPIAPPLPTLEQWITAGYVNVKSVLLENNKVTVGLKNGSKEVYDLNDAKQKASFEEKYGAVPDAPAPSIPPAPPSAPKQLNSWTEKPDFLLTPAEKTEKTKREKEGNRDRC